MDQEFAGVRRRLLSGGAGGVDGVDGVGGVALRILRFLPPPPLNWQE